MIWFSGERTGLRVQAASVEKGMTLVNIMRSEYRWRKVRNEHIRHEDCCQMCSIIRELEVHHVNPWHLAPELRYDPENLITLCRDCHFRFGHWLNWKGFNPEIRKLCKYSQDLKKGDKNEEVAHSGLVTSGNGRC